MTDIIRVLHDAVETHLPQLANGDDRQAALCYLRGLKTSSRAVRRHARQPTSSKSRISCSAAE